MLLNKLQRIKFSAFQLLLFDYDIFDSTELQSKINDSKKEMRDTCLLHYNMDLNTVQRYGGG